MCLNTGKIFCLEDVCLRSFSELHFTLVSGRNRFKETATYSEHENKEILGNTAFNCGKQKQIPDIEIKNDTKFP